MGPGSWQYPSLGWTSNNLLIHSKRRGGNLSLQNTCHCITGCATCNTANCQQRVRDHSQTLLRTEDLVPHSEAIAHHMSCMSAKPCSWMERPLCDGRMTAFCMTIVLMSVTTVGPTWNAAASDWRTTLSMRRLSNCLVPALSQDTGLTATLLACRCPSAVTALAVLSSRLWKSKYTWHAIPVYRSKACAQAPHQALPEQHTGVTLQRTVSAPELVIAAMQLPPVVTEVSPMNTRLEPSTTMPSVPRKLGSVEMPTASTATASLVWMCSAVCTKPASFMPCSVTCHTRKRPHSLKAAWNFLSIDF